MSFYSENTYIHAEYYKMWQKNKPHGTYIVADQAIKRQIGHWTLFQSLFPIRLQDLQLFYSPPLPHLSLVLKFFPVAAVSTWLLPTGGSCYKKLSPLLLMFAQFLKFSWTSVLITQCAYPWKYRSPFNSVILTPFLILSLSPVFLQRDSGLLLGHSERCSLCDPAESISHIQVQ